MELITRQPDILIPDRGVKCPQSGDDIVLPQPLQGVEYHFVEAAPSDTSHTVPIQLSLVLLPVILSIGVRLVFVP